MNKITTKFKQRQAFIAYLTAGFKGLDFSLQASLALIEGGVDILEIGVPFSDPIADGPVIQNATRQSLANGTTIFDVLTLIKKIRQSTDIPIILFSYFNPIFQATKNNFLQRAKQSGVDGVLVVDLPLEESSQYLKNCHRAEIAPIFVIAPSTSINRLKIIDKHANGFLYYACRNGITGMREKLSPGFAANMQAIKQHTTLPVAAGFGISSRQTAEAALKYADGFVVGSFFIDAIEHGATPAALKNLAQQIDPKNKNKNLRLDRVIHNKKYNNLPERILS